MKKFTWSFSKSRIFNKCQRQWFFGNYVSKWQGRDGSLGREAYILSTLQTVSQWRGSIVDKVISDLVVTALNRNIRISYSQTLSFAKRLFINQLEFGRSHRVREPRMSKSKAGDHFAAFHDLEYEGTISEQSISRAWDEIEQALKNFYGMHDLFSLMSAASYNIPQRPLQYSYLDSTIKAQPDVISFFDAQKPSIIDWKVHYFGTKDYRIQLSLYAMALKRCNPHKDFPVDLDRWEEDSLKLIEAQLLTNQIREYSISFDDIHKVEDYMAGSITEMRLALDSDSNLTAFDFPPTNYPEACTTCSFKKLCWEQ